MNLAIDPISHRCAALANEIAFQRGSQVSYDMGEFHANSKSAVNAALYALVSQASEAARTEIAHYTARCEDAPEALQALKVSHARELVEDAFIAAQRAPVGFCKLAMFRDELAKRRIVMSIHDGPTAFPSA